MLLYTSLSLPDLQVETLCLELCCFVCVIPPSHLSCLSSSVGSVFVSRRVSCVVFIALRVNIPCITNHTIGMYTKLSFFSTCFSTCSVVVTTSPCPVPTINNTGHVTDWFDSLAECLHWNVRKQQKKLC